MKLTKDQQKEFLRLRKQWEDSSMTNEGIEEMLLGIRCKKCGGRLLKSQRKGLDICRCDRLTKREKAKIKQALSDYKHGRVYTPEEVRKILNKKKKDI
jgi:hypothetical protein